MKIKLKKRDYSLLDVLELLIEYDDRLIRRMDEPTLSKMTVQSEFDKVPPSVIVKVFRTHADKKDNKFLHMVFSNHGLIPFCDKDVLQDFKLEDPMHFWNFSHTDVKDRIFSEDVVFSDDEDALDGWQASLNFETIFETYLMDGSSDTAMFAFFVLLDSTNQS